MARSGVTYRDIAETAAQLEGRGQLATVDGIRQVLGTGSRTTIATHLKSWKAQKSSTAHNEIPHELASHVKGLWERLHVAADSRIEKIEQLSQQKLESLQKQLEQERIDYQALDRKYRETEARYLDQAKLTEKYRDDLSQSDQLNAKLETYNTVVKDQLQRLQVDNDRLYQMNSRLQANLENIQSELFKSQNDHEQLLAKERAIFIEQVKQLQLTNVDLIEQIKQLEIVKLQLTNERDSLKEDFALMDQTQQQEKIKISELSHELYNLQVNNETLINELNIIKQETKEKSLITINLERKNAVITEQISMLKNTVQELEMSKQLLITQSQHLSNENASLQDKLQKLINKHEQYV